MVIGFLPGKTPLVLDLMFLMRKAHHITGPLQIKIHILVIDLLKTPEVMAVQLNRATEPIALAQGGSFIIALLIAHLMIIFGY